MSRIDHDDIEHELRELFRDKADEAPLGVPATAPPQVLRRGRLRQAGTVLGAAGLTLLLIVASVAGLTRILGERGDDRDIGSGDHEVFERTATIEAFTVRSPSDWNLVNQWPLSMQIAVEGNAGASSKCVAVPGGEEQECEEIPGEATSTPLPVPHGLPMFQLTNTDLGLDGNGCRDGIPDSAAVLYVALDAERAIAGIADPSIPPFPPGEPGLPPEGDGPCGPGRYARFTVNGEPFFAWIGLGVAVSPADRATVETAYEMMSAIEQWTPSQPAHTTPGYVVAAGTTAAGDEWRIEARPGTDVELSLFAPDPSGAPQVSLGDEPVYWCCTSMRSPGEAGEPVFGAVQPEATGVEFRPSGGEDSIVGTILPSPPSLGADFDLFFIEGTDGLEGDVVALGLDSSAEPSPTLGPRTDVVELSGTYEGATWDVRFTGSFADRNACIEPVLDGEVFGQTCSMPRSTTSVSEALFFEGWSASFYVRAGWVPVEVVEIRFVSDDDAIVQTDFRCAVGPSGWTDPDVNVCVQLLPSIGSGTVRYVDAEGNVVSEEGIAWGSASPEPRPMPVQPIHGGTYWAVYPWLGDAGGPESNAVVGQLSEDFGIQAMQGELSCDDGAREALGTDAAWAVAVYFETQQEANAFAIQAGLLGHEADHVIARVTTYCLD